MRLLEPLSIGANAAPNRVLFGPHETNLGERRGIGDRHLAYYERRLRGGTGILVCEEASVHESDWPYERAPLADDCGPGWERLAQLGAQHGALTLAAIGHSGGQGSSAYSQRALWAPSNVPEVNSREVPKVMEHEDIAAVVQGFRRATERAVAAGLDGVEINAGQHSLVRQFLSGLTNLRDDEYAADKLRFAREVLNDVRSAAGDAVVGLRLSCDELAPWAGIVPDAAAEIAVELLPWIDYLVVVRGAIFSVPATRPDGHDEPGFNLGLVQQIHAAVGGRVPVIAQGSIVDPGQAEWALDDGRADAVEMTRAQIADPDLVAKLRAGQPERIRPCILCNQTCVVRDGRNPIISCVVDPRAGHELDDPDAEPAPRPDHANDTDTDTDDTTNAANDTPDQFDDRLRRAQTVAERNRRVVVVGGGVAGLEAARIAASRGWQVELCERSSRTGGVLRHAAAGSGRARLAAFADWLDAECQTLGVDINLDRDVTAADIEAWESDGVAVVLTTGGTRGTPTYKITKSATTRTADEVLDAAARDDEHLGLPDGPIAIWDPIGGPIAVSLAELLTGRGRDVTLVTPDLIVGTMLSRSGDLAPANTRLQQAGVTLVKRAVLRASEKNGVVVEDRFTAQRTTIKAAALIDAGPRLPDDELFEATGAHLPRAGDAVAPRTIYEAVLEARRVVFELSARGRIEAH